MKLRDVVLMGRFCGLQTVDECVLNFEMHYLDCIPHKEWNDARLELGLELQAYKSGDLVLDWSEIDKEVEIQMNEYIESEKAREKIVYPEPIEINFG